MFEDLKRSRQVIQPGGKVSPFYDSFTLVLTPSGAKSIPVRIWQTADYLKKPPPVTLASFPDWVKYGQEWHVGEKSGGVCYEFDSLWARHMNILMDRIPLPEVNKLASEWLITATEFLLHVHYKCHMHGRSSWPSTISFWSHTKDQAESQMNNLIKKGKLS